MNFAENCVWVCQNVDCMISADVAVTKFGILLKEAVVAEWLRRLTRNQFPSGSVGSNPTDCENFFVCVNYDIWKMLSATVSNSTFAIQHRWFSGRMLACHAGGPGSIPGRCKLFLANCSNKNISKVVEAPGIDPGTSRMLSERSTIWARPPKLNAYLRLCL